ncbi:MAG: hypothetical protein KR126chlam2_00916 [Chlamydiae bacterium]|nr:hypothetical protein [Chlamydiota bacterium]
MITVKITTVLLIYLTSILFSLFGVWLFTHLRQRKKTLLPPLYELAICEYCRYNYLVESDKPVNKCPQCNALNKDNKYKNNLKDESNR